MALYAGDLITLLTDEDSSNEGYTGFLASDDRSLSSTTSEKLIVAPAGETKDKELVHPPAYASRCIFRIETTRARGALADGFEIMYGTPIALVHAATEMCLVAISSDNVELQPVIVDEMNVRRYPQGAIFIAEPRYKLRSEGDRISSGDHILLAPRRFSGMYLHSNGLVPPKYRESFAETSIIERAFDRARATSSPGPPDSGALPSPRAMASLPIPSAPSSAADALSAATSAAASALGINATAAPATASPVPSPRAALQGLAGTMFAAFKEVVDDDDATLLKKEAATANVASLTSRVAHGWVIARFASRQGAADDAVAGELRGGEYVRLFHREREGYLNATLDTAALRENENPLDPILNLESEGRAFAVRVKPSNMMRRATYSQSATNIWQCQPVSQLPNRAARAVHFGDILTWASNCRFRHVSSGRYLAVLKDEKTGAHFVSTVADVPLNNLVLEQTTFSLDSVVDDDTGTPIPLNSFGRLRHNKTELYLVLTDAGVPEGAPGLAILNSMDEEPGLVGGGTKLPLTPRGALSAMGTSRWGAKPSASVSNPAEAFDDAASATGSQGGAALSQFGAKSRASAGGGGGSYGKLQLPISLSATASEKDVFGVQPLALPGSSSTETLRQLHIAQRDIAMLTRFARHLQVRAEESREREKQNKAYKAFSVGKSKGRRESKSLNLADVGSLAEAMGKDSGKAEGKDKGTHMLPPDKDLCDDVVFALKELACLAVGLNYKEAAGRIDVFKIDETPKKRVQNLLRNQLAIEHLIKIVDIAWETYFADDVARVKQCRAGTGWSHKGLGPLSEICELCHAVLRSLVRSNNRCAEQLHSLDWTDKLLRQLPTGWAPPVVEVFDALMRHKTGSGGHELDKSDIRQMVDMIDKELRKADGQAGAAELLDFLSSVCRTEGQGHEKMQIRTTQLLCGLVAEGVDPHLSRLVYHLRLVCEPAVEPGPNGDSPLRAVEVQISTFTKGKTRPAYRVEDDEAGEEDNMYDDDDDDLERRKLRIEDEVETPEDEVAMEQSFVDVLTWMPHEEKIGTEWYPRPGKLANGRETPEGAISYFRAQLKLFAHLCFGRNLKTSDTMVELVPLEMLLTLLDPPKPTDRPPCRLLPRDQHLVCEVVLWLYLDSAKLDAVKETLISPLHLWEPQPPPREPKAREEYLDSLICSPDSQLSYLEADDRSPWKRDDDKQGVPVWVRNRGAGTRTTPVPSATSTEAGGASTKSRAQSGIHSASGKMYSCSGLGGKAAEAALSAAGSFREDSEVSAGLRLSYEGEMVKDVLELYDNEDHIAEQQNRLLKYVQESLSERDVLVYRTFVPPSDATEVQLQGMAEEKERFRFNLSVLRMMRLMAADGMYLPDYQLQPLGAEPRSSMHASLDMGAAVEEGAGARTAAADTAGVPTGALLSAVGTSSASAQLASADTREAAASVAAAPPPPARSATRPKTASKASTQTKPKTFFERLRQKIEEIRKLEKMLVRVLRRSEPQEYIRGAAVLNSTADEADASQQLLQLLYTRTTEADEILVDAKIELCKILQLLYDMYTDARMNGVISRYKRIYTEHVELKLWSHAEGVDEHVYETYEETMPFDKIDTDKALPASLVAQYPGLRSLYTYAEVFERMCYLDLRHYVTDTDLLFETKIGVGDIALDEARKAAGGSADDDAFSGSLTDRLMNLTLYDDLQLKAEAFTLLQRKHSQREELLSSLAKVRFIVDREEKETLEMLRASRSKFATISATANTAAPTWELWSNNLEEFRAFSLMDADILERAFQVDPSSSCDLDVPGKPGRRQRVLFDKEGYTTVVMVKLHKVTGEEMWTAKKGKPATTVVRRRAPHPQLIEIISNFQEGVVRLCYSRKSDETCPHTGRPYNRADPDESAKHDAEIQARLADGEAVERFEPSKDLLESANQAMMVAEGWHKQVLSFLGCYGDGSMGKRMTPKLAKELDTDHGRPRLKLVDECYRLLYYICFDHPENWEHFSDQRTLNFLFQQLADLAEVEVDASGGYTHRLNFWVGKLLEEVIVDNAEANKRLDVAHVDSVVHRMVLDGDRGRTQYVAILKAIVEDELGPLPLRQVQVIEALTRVKEMCEDVGQKESEVLLFYQDESNNYLVDEVMGLLKAERERVVANGWTFDEDGLPDPGEPDCALNYHLELVDLLGMCAKGRNEFTEKYSRTLFDEDDVMTILERDDINTLIRSPFVRMMHGVFFSVAASDESGQGVGGQAEEAGGGLSGAAKVMTDYWPQFVKLFRSFERDIKNFSVQVRLDEKNEEMQREKERALKERDRAASQVDESELTAVSVKAMAMADDEPPALEAGASLDEISIGETSTEGTDAAEKAAIEAAEAEEEREEREEELAYTAAKKGSADDDDDDSAEADASFDLLENYIFFVMFPFLTDFYSSDEFSLRQPEDSSSALESGNLRGVLGEASAKAPDEAEVLIEVSRNIAKVARRMVKLEYVMGSEMLRDALDRLLKVLYTKTVPDPSPGRPAILLIQNTGERYERKRLNDATLEIDEWAEDEDLKDSGGEMDIETQIERVRKKFVTRIGWRPFESALSQCMWQRDHKELSERRDEKSKLKAKDGSRDWELLIQPPIPPSAFLGKDDMSRWRKGRTHDGKPDDGLIVDTSMLGEWSAEFNELVDKYYDCVSQMVCTAATGATGSSGGADLDEAKSAKGTMSVGMATGMLTDLVGQGTEISIGLLGGGRHTSIDSFRERTTTRQEALRPQDFMRWTEYGKRYIAAMFEHLKACESDRYMETNQFILDILTYGLLATSLEESQVKTGVEGTAAIEMRRQANVDEQASLRLLQEALADAGAIDVIISVIAAARDLSARTTYQQAIVPKLIGLAAELVHYGPEQLQNAFLVRIKESLSGYSTSKDFLPTLKEQLLNPKRGCVVMIKQSLETSQKASSAADTARQEEKRIAKLRSACEEAKTLLLFLQMLCENHNVDAQRYLQKQSATRSIDLVASVAVALRDVGETVAEHMYYVKDNEAVRKVLDQAPPTSAVGPTVMAVPGFLRTIKFVAWHMYSPGEAKSLELQFSVARQCFESLAEFVQGPCKTNQELLASKMHICEMVAPFFDLLLALQLYGRPQTQRRASMAANQIGEWAGSAPVKLAKALMQAFTDSKNAGAEFGEVERWVLRAEAGNGEKGAEARELAAAMLKEARLMEVRLLMFLSGMLEGETDLEVAEHMTSTLSPTTLIALLNVHWQRSLQTQRSALSGHADEDKRDEYKAETDLTFLYFSTLQLLADDTDVATPAAEKLRTLFRKWMANEGRDIVGHTRRIEIVDGDGKLARVYFQMPEFVETVWRSAVVEEAKRELLFKVNRDSPEEKLKDFWLRIDSFVAILKHQHRIRTLRHRGGPLWWLFGVLIELITRGHTVFYYGSLSIAVIINILLLFPRVTPDEDSPVNNGIDLYLYYWGIMDNDSGAAQNTFRGLSAALIVMTALELAAHVLSTEVLRIQEELKLLHTRGGVKLKVRTVGVRGRTSTTKDSPICTKIAALLRGEEIVWRVSPYTYLVYSFFSDWDTILFLFFLLTAILSLSSISGPEWACVNLLVVARRVPEMQYVAQVVSKNFAQLISTLTFVVLIIYIFSVFAYTNPSVTGQYAILDKTPDMLGSNSLLLNSLFFWDYGFREAPAYTYTFTQRNLSELEIYSENSADFPDKLDLAPDQIDRGEVFVGFIFNFLYHIIIILVFSAVVSGIIIDAFAELRSDNNRIKDDVLNTCFICNIEREDFEQLNLDFKKHVREEHNLWDYAFFRLYLDKKEREDYSGLETYCADLIHKQNITWFPIKKAKVIEGRNKEKKDLPGLFRRLLAMEKVADKQGASLGELRAELSTVRRSTDEIKDLIKTLVDSQASF